MNAFLDLARQSFFAVRPNGSISYASKGIYTFNREFFLERGIDAFDFLLAEGAKLRFSELLNSALESHGEIIREVYESINLESIEESHFLQFEVKSTRTDKEQLLYIAVSDCTDIVRAEHQISQREDELSLFSRIAFQKHLHDDDSILFKAILQLIAKAVNADGCLLYTRAGSDDEQLLTAEHGVDAGNYSRPLAKKIARLRRVNYTSVISARWRRVGYECKLTIPLELHSERVGTLIILSFTKHAFSWVQVRLLRRVAEYLSIMVSTELLWRQKEQLAAITNDVFSNSNDGLMILDRVGTVVEKNPLAHKMLGESQLLTQAVSPQYETAVTRFIQQLQRSGRARVRLTFVTNRPAMYEITGSQISGGLPAQYLCVARDVSEWVDTAHTLRQQASELIHIDRMKDEFISLVSHELRSPLTVLKGNISLIGREIAQQQLPERQHILTIENNLNRLERLVNDILEITRLEYGDIRFEPTTVDLRELATTMREYVIRASGDKQIQFVDKIEVAVVINDADRLFQIIRNLIDNAVKNIERSGTISFRVVARSETVVITVSDNGPGLSLSQQAHIFDRFYRSNVNYSGSGLGLYIVSKLLKRMGGTIRVKSQVGRGATFTIIIPQRLAAA